LNTKKRADIAVKSAAAVHELVGRQAVRRSAPPRLLAACGRLDARRVSAPPRAAGHVRAVRGRAWKRLTLTTMSSSSPPPPRREMRVHDARERHERLRAELAECGVSGRLAEDAYAAAALSLAAAADRLLDIQRQFDRIEDAVRGYEQDSGVVGSAGRRPAAPFPIPGSVFRAGVPYGDASIDAAIAAWRGRHPRLAD
jgi:hypothetical protein